VTFYAGGDKAAEEQWRAAVLQSQLDLADFPTSQENMLLASEVKSLSKHSHKAQDVDLGLTFLALKTGLPISFSLDQEDNSQQQQQIKSANQFHNGTLHIGGHDISENDDFGMSFKRDRSGAPFDVFAFGEPIRRNAMRCDAMAVDLL